MNLVEGFLATARQAGGRTAIVTGAGETISFDRLAMSSGRLAASLKGQGVRRGDRVLVAMPVGIALYCAIAALWRLGAIIVFPEPAMGLGGVRHAVEIAAPVAVLATGPYRLLPFVLPTLWTTRRLGLAEADGDPIEDLAADHPALISFTSGSTGSPKGIVRSHAFLAAQNAALHDLLAPRRDHETDLVAFPVFVIANLSLGTTSVLPNWRVSRHDLADAASVGRHIVAHGVTRLLVPPSVAEILADAGGTGPLDALFTGGGPVFPDLLERLSRALPGTEIVTVYGSTEAEPIACQRLSDIGAEQWRRMRDGGGLLAGRPIPGIAVDIVADEIVVTGDHVNKTYLGGVGDAENKIHREGAIWHRTGDAGQLDADGLLWLRGRLASVTAGRYAFEFEAVARSWPGVKRVALVPGADPPLLALEGDEPSPGGWAESARRMFGAGIVKLDLPMDRRHRSKIDYTALSRQVRRRRFG